MGSNGIQSRSHSYDREQGNHKPGGERHCQKGRLTFHFHRLIYSSSHRMDSAQTIVSAHTILSSQTMVVPLTSVSDHTMVSPQMIVSSHMMVSPQRMDAPNIRLL